MILPAMILALVGQVVVLCNVGDSKAAVIAASGVLTLIAGLVGMVLMHS